MMLWINVHVIVTFSEEYGTSVKPELKKNEKWETV